MPGDEPQDPRGNAPEYVGHLEDDWSVAATKTLLGASLVAQRRYGDAEVVLLDTRRDLDMQPHPPARDVTATITGLVQLYEAWRKREAAAACRALLAS